MIQPDALKSNKPLFWSPGRGADLWAMFRAAAHGDLKSLKRLLKKDPDLIRASWDYRTPLAFAVRENCLEAARFLLERGADPVNSGTPDTLLKIARERGFAEMQALLEGVLAGRKGGSPEGEAIAAAIRARDLDKVRAMLDADPKLVHAADERTNQPIHWAVATRNIPMIDEVLARGADIDAKRNDGARPIQLTNGDYMYRGWRDVPKDVATTWREVLDHLRAKGAFCDICTASYIGDAAQVRALLKKDKSLANKPSEYVTYYACSGTPLSNATRGGHLDVVKLLIEAGADPNLPEEGIAPLGHALHSAVVNNHIEVVRYLLEKGAHPNVPVESSADTLSAVIWRKDQAMIDLLCSHGAARSMDLLGYSGDVQVAAAVLKANPKLADDPSALESAAGQGHEGFVRLMLKYQPDLAKRVAVGVRSKGPQDAIKSRAITDLLFAHGMNASHRNWLRITPLHRFAERDDVENAAIFIEHGADVNAREEEFLSTPLGWAAKFGKVRVAELLLLHGAKTNLPGDPAWATPLAWATRRKHEAVAELLRAHGAAK
ncbi:MAG: ankyrin repeat domain-containing protein [Planctomycetota bacterium]|nr:ankyrin repeat domain-containing protein [Planctomycetota bacterium]